MTARRLTWGRKWGRAISADRRGVVLTEFAIVLPVLVILVFYGLEIGNYAVTRQKASQLALQIADDGSRIGVQEVLRNRPITEAQINDIFTGAQLQSGKMDVAKNGRIILSGLTVNSLGGQWIQWQRCYGALASPSHYGAQGDGKTGISLKGMGPATTKVVATSASPVVFVELVVKYTPVIAAAWAPSTTISEIASFAVRDDRDTTGTGVQNDAKAPVSSCN